MPDPVTCDLFEPLVGHTFTVTFYTVLEPASIALQLTSVTRLGPPHRSGAREPFAIYFLGPEAPVLPQRTYRLGASLIPEPMDIFLVPIARGPAGITYEAIFT